MSFIEKSVLQISQMSADYLLDFSASVSETCRKTFLFCKKSEAISPKFRFFAA